MSKPMSPREIGKLHIQSIPPVVFDVFNELLARHYSSGEARVVQDDVVAILVEKGLNKEEIYRKHWLDIEDAYRANGWHVEYDKPGYDESYGAFFIFQKVKESND